MDLDPPVPNRTEHGNIDWEGLAKDPRGTESRGDLTKLYDLSRLIQLNDEYVRQLTDEQLIFLAAHDPAVASFDIEMRRAQGVYDHAAQGSAAQQSAYIELHDLAAQKNKLEQTARRCRLELENRRAIEARERTIKASTTGTRLAALIGVGGAIVGGLLVAWLGPRFDHRKPPIVQNLIQAPTSSTLGSTTLPPPTSTTVATATT